MKKIIASIAVLVSLALGAQSVFALSNSLDIGSTGSDVTSLQTYLTNSTNYYPSGLITGYYGPLTAAAVQKFQAAQGIVSSGSVATTGYGRVGPVTMARLNSLMSGGSVSLEASPYISGTAVQFGRTEVTLSFTSNEATQGQVYYSSNPLVFYEATGPHQLPYVSGSSVVDNGGQMSHAITLRDLQPGTTYYFLTRVVDNETNMSMTWPSSFQTNQ